MGAAGLAGSDQGVMSSLLNRNGRNLVKGTALWNQSLSRN